MYIYIILSVLFSTISAIAKEWKLLIGYLIVDCIGMLCVYPDRTDMRQFGISMAYTAACFLYVILMSPVTYGNGRK